MCNIFDRLGCWLYYVKCGRQLTVDIHYSCSKAGINDMFEGHQGPVTGIDCHAVPGAIDFSPYFITSSFDWTVKLWNIKVRAAYKSNIEYTHFQRIVYKNHCA